MSDFALPNSSTDLNGKVALVTGSASGLGWRFAKVLAASGARVVVTGPPQPARTSGTARQHAALPVFAGV